MTLSRHQKILNWVHRTKTQPRSRIFGPVHHRIAYFSCPNPGPSTPEPSLLHADALQRLVALSHGHGQECGFVPDVKPPASGSPAQLVWECVAGHSFSWGVPTVADGQQPWGVTEEDLGSNSPPVPGRRRSLRRAGLVAEPKVDGSSPKKDGAEAEVAAWSPAGDGNQREEAGESSHGGKVGWWSSSYAAGRKVGSRALLSFHCWPLVVQK